MSEFTKMLGRMLDAPTMNGVPWTRHEWSTILACRIETIAKWVNEESFPSPEPLRRIYSTLRDGLAAGTPGIAELMAEWDAMARKPFNKISPIAVGDYRTLGHYMVRPLVTAFLETLNTIKPEQQESVLLAACALVRKQRDG